MTQTHSQLRDTALSIYGYTDYRKYLKDYYEFKKSRSRTGYSYRAFSKAAHFSSPNFLKLIIEGQRNISAEATEKIVSGLRLNSPMANYFRSLVKMNQAKSDVDKEKHFHELQLLTPHAKKRLLHVEEHEYLSHWLYPVIREMIELDEFVDDPYWIARRINCKATVAQIASALQFLIQNRFIEKQASGKYVANDQMVISSDEVKNLSIRNYHRQMLDLARETLESLPVEEREFGAITLTLPEHAIQELKFRLKTFRDEIHNWAMLASKNAGHETVVQLNFQMYPHTKRKGAAA